MWDDCLRPSEAYTLELDNGDEVVVDFSNRDDFRKINREDESCSDEEGVHRRITDVFDISQESHIGNDEFFQRAEQYELYYP